MLRGFVQLPKHLRGQYIWDERIPDHCFIEIHYRDREKEAGHAKAERNARQIAGFLIDILKEKGVTADINSHFASRLNKTAGDYARWLEGNGVSDRKQLELDATEAGVCMCHMALEALKSYDDLPHVVAVRRDVAKMLDSASATLRRLGGNPNDVIQDEALKDKLKDLLVWSHLDFVPLPDEACLSFSCHLPDGERSLPAFEETLKQAALILPMREQQKEVASRQERKRGRKGVIRDALQNFSGSLIMEHNISDITNEVYRALARNSRRGGRE